MAKCANCGKRFKPVGAIAKFCRECFPVEQKHYLAKMQRLNIKKERVNMAKRLTARKGKVVDSVTVPGIGTVELVEGATVPVVPEPALAPAEYVERPYAVLVDTQGVAYLRVAVEAKHSLFVINTGSAVELIKMDAGTVASRGLQVVETDILAAAKILFTPLTESVIVGERAKKHLTEILNDEEWKANTMATEKKHRSAAKGKKGAARAKSTKTATPGVRAANAERKITLVAKENPKREKSSSFKRFALYKTGMTVGEFIAKGGTMADVNYDSAKGYVKVSG